jgi:cytoskeletal protein CcmA (bactofilin family)
VASSPTLAPAASVIGPGANIKGDVLGEDDVVVQGSVEGVVRISRELRVAPGGRVNATVHAASIVVSGEIVGNCVATHRIDIQASGRVTGDIRAPRIAIAEGASFKGKSEMGRSVEKAAHKPVE